MTVNQDVAGSSPAVAAKAFPIYFNIKKTVSDKVTVNLSPPLGVITFSWLEG